MTVADALTLEQLEQVARGAPPPALDDDARRRLAAARAVVERAVDGGEVVYGVTTGVGDLANVRIEPEDAERLQLNLVRSHAVGAGPPLSPEVVRGMMLLLAVALARGHSGVRPAVVELLLAMLERGVVPVVPSKGSVGSSGDLAPLAHLALVLVGEGEADVGGERLPGADALRRAGLEPLALTAKEGLALVNGTHLMAAAGGLALREAERLVEAARLPGGRRRDLGRNSQARVSSDDVRELRRLGDGETLLVQSGKPMAVFETRARAAR